MIPYRELILAWTLGITVILIVLVLVLPLCFRLFYNKCKCCRSTCTCKYAKPKKRELECMCGTKHIEDIPADKYDVYFEPSIPAQVFVFMLVGFFFVAICGLTDVPFYVMWFVIIIVWTSLYIDFMKRRTVNCATHNSIEMKARGREYTKGDDKDLRTKFPFEDKIVRYLEACRDVIIARKNEFIVAFVVILVVSMFSTLFSSCMCIASSPVSGSTWMSRKFDHKYCISGEICNVLFTMADRESYLIMNFHASEKPEMAFVVYDVVSHPRDFIEPAENWITAYSFSSIATTYKVNTVSELTRYVNWADITNLTGGTYYYFVAVYMSDGMTVVSAEYKVKTLSSTGGYSFITGGDMSMDGDASTLIDHAIQAKPDFAMIGGDVAYDNGFEACYLRWDMWIHRWRTMMVHNGTSIPVILTVGNHEAGRWFAPMGSDPYYSTYFPQQVNLQNVFPRSRLPYHVHRLGSMLTIIALDSDVVTRMDGDQQVWLENVLANSSGVKVALYHGNIYPSSDILDVDLAGKGKAYWVPLFDKYNVTMVFENHVHSFKRTKPMRNDTIDPNGITYFGDGAWGVQPVITPMSSASYLEKSSKTQHFFHVTVPNSSYVKVNAIDSRGNIFDSWEKHLL